MDRLEEIKALRNDAGFYANITIHDKATEQVDFLISEIERLRKEKVREAKRNYLEIALNIKLIGERDILKKEKEWLIKLLYEKLVVTPIPIEVYRESIIDMMQQALKE